MLRTMSVSVSTESSPGELRELFAPGSPLAQAIPGFAPRPGQTEMAAAVATAVTRGENLIVEAGTGTGKTLAYLLPALLSGERVVISTGTKTLQDQLFHRDLPNVASVLGRPVRTVLLKGRANYLCLQRLATASYAKAADRSDLEVIERWSRETRTGDRAEVSEVAEESSVWPRVTSTVENCLGSRCEFYSRCHVVAARQAAMEAELVVVNHHLLLADMMLKEEGFGELLPGAQAVIVDEAHQFPDVAQSFFSRSLSSRSLQNLAEDLRVEALQAVAPATGAGAAADGLLKAVADLRLALPRDAGSVEWSRAEAALESGADELTLALDDVIRWLEDQDTEVTALQRCLERARSISGRLELIAGGDDTAGLKWAGLGHRSFSLNYTPVEVADSLKALLERHECGWVFTSATLTVGDSFAHFQRSAGVETARTLSIPSPFDYAFNGRLLLPAGLPPTDSVDYTRYLLAYLLPLLRASGGRAFLLFTSHRALREAAEWLRSNGPEDLSLLVQGEAPRSRLLEQFIELDRPLLLGTSSFWEGVDIRGDHLVLVAIDKLPFASPGDPLLKARLTAIRQRGGNPFRDYQLPQAVLSLKQGVGRLIRDASDRGVVVLCDPRLQQRGYGKAFLASLPSFTRTASREDAEAFLEQTARG